MRIGHNLKRIRDFIRASSLERELKLHEQWTSPQIKAYQDQKMRRLVKYALEHSPFYREFYGQIDTDKPFEYECLPVLTKKTMMDNFDRFVTDPRLKLSDLQDHLEHITRDEYFLGQYKVFSTGGSSGLTGIFAYDRKEWAAVGASALRVTRFHETPLRFPKRRRMATVSASHPRHLTWRLWDAFDFGFINFLRLSVLEPIHKIVDALNEFRPDTLYGYPSILVLLAIEQIAGRLHIQPEAVTCSAEVLTDDMKQKIQTAWGKTPLNTYGTTEVAMLGSSCVPHNGMHLFEDLLILEVVDENYCRVPDGVLGHKILTTNLNYYTQPLIRYELTDMVQMAKDPCPCGRNFPLIEKVEGRSDDILKLEGIHTRVIPVHPIIFRSPLGNMRDVLQYQVVQMNDGLHFNVVLHESADRDLLVRNIESAMRNALDSQQVKCPPLFVHCVGQIEREKNLVGKLKLVKKEFR